MILTNELETVDTINETALRKALQKEINTINACTDYFMDVYNTKHNHFTIFVNELIEYDLDITGFTAELSGKTSTFDDDVLLAAIIDDSGNFEEKLAIKLVSTIYHKCVTIL